MRESRSLAGQWQFQLDAEGQLSATSLSPNREITVPLPWQAAFPELQQYSGYAWYRRTFELDPAWLDGELLLHFGAVDYWCQVYLNGQLIETHEGGYTPFTIAARDYARQGENELVVRVYDVAQEAIVIPRWPARPVGDASPPFDARQIPHGKQEWYLNVGGIWQDVTLTAVPRAYIDNVRITPNIHTGEAEVAVDLAGQSVTGGSVIRVILWDGDNRVGETTIPLSGGARQVGGVVTVSEPKLWSPETPHLYRAEIMLEGDDSADTVTTRFGFREISTRDGKLLLNGEPIVLLAALDQDFYPETIYTVPSRDYLADQFRKTKELGLNCVRCHIKVPEPVYYELADEMGLLVWTEIPSWQTFQQKDPIHADVTLTVPDAVRARVEATLEAIIRRDYNHPSIVIWTIVNEDWGTSLYFSASDRAWLAAMYDRCKALDPTRLVVDNSPCPSSYGPNFHVKSDLDDFHIYMTIPDYADSWEDFIEQFALRPQWTYSLNGDIQRTGNEPLILSEFGNWGLPTAALLRQGGGGQMPPWFELGPWWSPWDGAPGWPEHVEERFKALGLDALWPDYDSFATQTQWHEYESLKFEIETIRRHPSIQGYVITELTDIYWEANGLLDFYRNPKAYHNKFATFNTPDVIIPTPNRYSFFDDEQMRVRVYGSHYSGADWSGARLRWRSESDSGEVPIPPVARGEVRLLEGFEWSLPRVSTGEPCRFEFTLVDGGGQVLAENTLDVLVLPARARKVRYEKPVAVVAQPGRRDWTRIRPEVGTGSVGTPVEAQPQGHIAASPPVSLPLELALTASGYATAAVDGHSEIAVTNVITASLLEWVAAGGKLLYLCDGPNPFFWTQPRGGRWITGYNWLRPEIFTRLKVENPLMLPYRDAAPRFRIVGLPMDDASIQGDFLGGQVLGWLGLPALHTVQFRYGKGKVIMTTLYLERMMTPDPVSRALLHDLVEYLASDRCQPTLTVEARV